MPWCIDHGKSTLADRMLGITEVVEARNMRAQYLDRMDIERERGITIKSQAVRLPWRSGIDGQEYILSHLLLRQLSVASAMRSKLETLLQSPPNFAPPHRRSTLQFQRVLFTRTTLQIRSLQWLRQLPKPALVNLTSNA